MLTNLLHYEFKSTGRVVLPIAAGVLVLNIFTNILSHFVQNTSDRLPLAGVAMALLAPGICRKPSCCARHLLFY